MSQLKKILVAYDRSLHSEESELSLEIILCAAQHKVDLIVQELKGQDPGRFIDGKCDAKTG